MVEHKLSALIITLSDRASKGMYEDISGQALEAILSSHFKENNIACAIERSVIPDDANLLSETFTKAVNAKTDFIFTTGGTGIGPRDVTPDVIRPLLSKEIPGIMEVIRVRSSLTFPSAALSRSIAGTASQSLVYCLPGSPKAIKEYMDVILLTLLHCHKMVYGEGHG
jgi:molybdenum cofactor synthesis domain-containing protein